MSAPRILVVDDEADLRELLEITLLKMGLDVDSAATVREARGLLGQKEYALVLTDMRLPDGMGLELVREVAGNHRHTPIAVITAYGSAENAVVALKAGAFDYVSKPVVLDDLRRMVRSALKLLDAESAQGAPHAGGSRLIGGSQAMQALRAQIERLARSQAPIAINGESGSGKELAAREIHAQSARAGKAFVAVNCGAIPEALMEAEFFGYRKGAFTGANDERDGFFQAASGGTLMLDEVADLPLAMQVKLLRAIQERRVRKIGATAEEAVDVRIVSATHKDLGKLVENGGFRQDLFYRLNVIELTLPPLRERLDDLPLLTDAILARLAGPGKARLGAGVLEALQAYSFPGNVRELENVLERALAFADDGVIEVGDLLLKGARLGDAATRADTPARVQAPAHAPAPEAVPPAPLATAPAAPATAEAPATPSAADPLPSNLPDYLSQVERDIILRALNQTQFNRTQAAGLLGISVRQLRYQMQKLDIQAPEA
ncbi:sigma-54 dependent transcriptional regulator [Massilia sp. 9096]|uniref:sigma-54-dependent transcriptional regulator n=1 Tax=Massilia sp. 9096 TaxID=1500894 RepID=UPI00055CB4DA|nr:sigma-54 dependent transcriptional regulator [Massilia sp. 9096]